MIPTEKIEIKIQVEKYKYDALSAYLAMKNNSIEGFMRKHFDDGYLQMVDEPVRKYVEFTNGINVPAALRKRPVPKKKPAEGKPSDKNVVSGSENSDNGLSAEGGDNDAAAD